MPDWRTEIRSRLASAGLPPEREAEIADEIAQHLDDRYRDGLSAGRSADEAIAGAWRELEADGALEREIARVERPMPRLPPPGVPSRGSIGAALWQDLKYAIRRLSKRPVFSLTAVVTVALTVGPATAIFGVADAIFFQQPSGIQAPDRLFKMQFGRPVTSPRGAGFSPWFVSYANVNDVLSGATSVTAMTGEQPLSVGFAANGSDPLRIAGSSVQANFFRVLGVHLAAGRGFLDEEDATPGGVTSVVIADALARDLFTSPEAALGQTVQLNSVSFTIVGVTERAFEGTGTPAKFWITGRAYHRVRHFAPERWTYPVNGGPFNTFLARMAPGASVAGAEAELRVRIAGLADSGRDQADLFKTINMRLLPGLGAPRSLNVNGVEIIRQLALVAGLLVLLGIANTANLLIFQGLKTSREVAIRKALGASAGRLIQLILVESLLLSSVGAALGIGVALGIQALLSDVSVWGIGTVTVPLDWRLLGAAATLAVVTGIGFGVGPALLSARGSALAALGRGVRTELPRAGRLRQGLASLQLALSLVLLVGALLFLTTLDRLRRVDLGFDASNVTTMQMDLRSHGYDVPRIFAFYQELIARVKQRPGIDDAAVTFALPIAGAPATSSLYLSGADPATAPAVLINFVSPTFFDVLRIPIARGRTFTNAEAFPASAPATIVLNGVAARSLFGDADPIGRVVVEPGRPARVFTVIGVAADNRWQNVTSAPDAMAYEPFGEGLAATGGIIIARSSRPAPDVVADIRSAAASLDRSTPLFRDQTMTAVIAGRLAQQRLFAWILGLLGAIGFTLAAIGLHALVSQMVTERAREFGIRLAIGADRRVVSGLVLRQAAIVAGAGAVAGLGAARLTGRFIEANLFGVTSRDPATYAVATALLVVVVILAIISPIRAATRVDPIAVLRTE